MVFNGLQKSKSVLSNATSALIMLVSLLLSFLFGARHPAQVYIQGF